MSSENATYSMILCALMSQRLKERGIMQRDFFQKSGIATGSWSRIARGQAHFQIEDLRAACKVLDWSVGALIGKADEMAKSLEQKEHVNVVTKDELKSKDSSTGAFIAGAALTFLLMRLS